MMKFETLFVKIEKGLSEKNSKPLRIRVIIKNTKFGTCIMVAQDIDKNNRQLDDTLTSMTNYDEAVLVLEKLINKTKSVKNSAVIVCEIENLYKK